MLDIELDLQGQRVSEWPCINITVNNDVKYDGIVTQNSTFKIKVDDLLPENRLRLTHYGKHFGDHGVYDTDPENDLDRGIMIKDIRFDRISLGDHKIRQLLFQTSWTPYQTQHLDPDVVAERSKFECNGYMGFNGFIEINFWTPILEWLTVYKYKTDRVEDLAYFSAYDQRWHYEKDLELIKEIKRLMNFE